MEIRGYLYVLLAALMWGLIGPISKFVFAEGVTPLETAFWRAVFTWGMFAIHARCIGAVTVQKRDVPSLVLFGVLCVSVFYGAYQLAVQDVGAALASVLLYTAPAWVALMSWLMLGERMTPVKIGAVAMTLCGVWLVSAGPGLLEGGANITVLGLLFGLTSGFTYALYYIFGKLYLGRYQTPTLFLYALPLGAALLFPFIDFAPKTPRAWFFLLVLAGCSTYGAYSVYYHGLKRLEATRAAVVATLEPVMAALLAYLWWDEELGLLGYAGSALIIGAVFVTILGERAQPPGEGPETPSRAMETIPREDSPDADGEFPPTIGTQDAKE